MKRRIGEHGISTDELGSKQRIVRRKVHRSLSPVDLESRSSKRLREVEKHELYDKYNSKYDHRDHNDFDKYTPKYDHRPHKGVGLADVREERAGKGSFVDKPHRVDYPHSHYGSIGTSRGREIHLSSNKSESLPVSPVHGHSGPRPGENFDYSLRVGNIDYKLSDNVVKGSLFKEFKRFGYVNIKVIGYGKDRHAFINFSRANDARAACNQTQKLLFHNRTLDVSWSRSTLNRFPDLLTGKFHEPRVPGSSKKRQVEESYEPFQVNVPPERDHFSGNSSRMIREISLRNGASGGLQRDRTQSSHHSNSEPKQSLAVLDPNATRTLFVGNLEVDITERELRDIFCPYGRIESVDIKMTRATNTAYSFVKFFTINDAINAKIELHGRQYGKYRLSIGFGKGNPSAKVWIGNVTCFADVSEIRKELDRFGLIRKVDYINDDNHAYVHFDGLDAAEAAVASLNNYRFKRTHKPLKLELVQHQQSARDFDSDFDDFDMDVGSYDSIVTSTTGGGGYGRNDEGNRYRPRVRELQRGSSLRGGSNAPFKPRERGGHIMSEGSSNSQQYTTEKFRHSHTRKRERSPSMHSEREFNGEANFHAKRSRNGFNAYEYHKMYRRTDKGFPPRSGERSSKRSHFSSTDDTSHRGEGVGSRDRSRDRASPKNKSHNTKSDDQQDETKSITSSSSDMPPPPLPIIQTDTPDTALNLDTSTEALSGNRGVQLVENEPAETLVDLARMYPVAWRGNLVLKNTGFPTRMHLIGGDPAVVEMLVRCREGKDETNSLRITQRLRLEPPRLDEVNKRMISAGPSGHCILIALPGTTPSLSSSPDHSSGGGLELSSNTSMQLRPLRSLVSYLKQKEAAGIVALNAPVDKGLFAGSSGELSEMNGCDKDNVGVLHAFPPCDFSQSQLLKVVPSLGSEPSKEDHIVVLLVKGSV